MTPSDDDRPLEPQRLQRLEALLAGLERVDAPDALRPRVEAALGDGDEAAASRVAATLVRLDAHSAPDALRARVERSLAADDDELERRAAARLEGLEALAAPDALRERVQLELSTDAPVSQLISDLERQRVPAVLERLVAEEMVDEKAVTRRFVGSLPKPGAPDELRSTVATRGAGRVLQGRFAPASVRAAAAAVLLIGTGVVLWTSGPNEARPERPSFRLEHRVAGSVDALGGGLASQFALALGVPASDAVRAAGSGDAAADSDSTDGAPTTDGGGR